jgi:hypothetical protein
MERLYEMQRSRVLERYEIPEYDYDIDTRLSMIARVFRLDDIARLPVSEDYIQKYYFVNKLAYSLFHDADIRKHSRLQCGALDGFNDKMKSAPKDLEYPRTSLAAVEARNDRRDMSRLCMTALPTRRIGGLWRSHELSEPRPDQSAS